MRLYQYLETKWALDNIRRRRLKLSKVDDMNDPYEWRCVHSADKESQQALEKTASEDFEQLGALCFSRCWNSILMWSHYGEKHMGICLGFDVPDELTTSVEYVREVRVVGDLSKAPTEERLKIVELLQWAKYDGWRYEAEVRVKGQRREVDEETGQYFVNFSKHPILKEVIAGARFKMSKAYRGRP